MAPTPTVSSALQPWVRRLALGHATTRTAIGAALLFTPKMAAGPWLGDGIDTGGGRVAMQAFAVRELVLGLGMLRGLRRHEPVRHWFRLGVAFELIDAGATVLHRRDLPAGRVPDAMALLGALGLAGGALVGAFLDE